MKKILLFLLSITACSNAADRREIDNFRKVLHQKGPNKLLLRYLIEKIAIINADEALDLVKSMLYEKPDLLNATLDGNRNTALHYAAHVLANNIVEFLIMMGADVNARNALGYTPLMMPIYWRDRSMQCKQAWDQRYTTLNSYDTIALLLRHGADTTPKNYEGKTALAISSSINPNHWAGSVEDLKKIIEMLKKCEADAQEKSKKGGL